MCGDKTSKVRYRILIVDDEKMIRLGIKNAMPWEKMHITEVYTASCAREAAEIIRQRRPEIMITDISMTEMSGLELVEQIRRENTEMRVIVLTGYDRFEYARQALQLQVHDFLLKPIDESELQKSIMTQVEWLEKHRIGMESSITSSRAQGVRQQVELEEFMRSLVAGKEDLGEQTEVFLREFHFQESEEMRIGILIPGVTGEEDPDSEGFRLQTVKHICIGMIDEKKRGITFLDEKSRIAIAFFCDEGRKEEELVEQLMAILSDELETKPRVIWGSVKKGIKNLWISYNDAVFTLDHEREEFEKLCAVNWNRKGEDIFQDVFREFRNALVCNVGDKEKIFHIFERFSMAVESYNLSAKYARSCCFELASSVYFARFSDTGSSADEKLSVLMQALSGADRGRACQVTAMFLENLFEGEDGEIHELIGKVKRRIHENLADDLTVTGLAEQYYVTPNYLSRLFKRVTGEGCNEYIVRKRIEQAKSLLATTTLKVGEISIMVGYHDMNYFSLAFKKHIGVSPVKYREQIQNGR